MPAFNFGQPGPMPILPRGGLVQPEKPKPAKLASWSVPITPTTSKPSQRIDPMTPPVSPVGYVRTAPSQPVRLVPAGSSFQPPTVRASLPTGIAVGTRTGSSIPDQTGGAFTGRGVGPSGVRTPAGVPVDTNPLTGKPMAPAMTRTPTSLVPTSGSVPRQDGVFLDSTGSPVPIVMSAPQGGPLPESQPSGVTSSGSAASSGSASSGGGGSSGSSSSPGASDSTAPSRSWWPWIVAGGLALAMWSAS